MKKLGVLAGLLFVVSCASNTPPNAAPSSAPAATPAPATAASPARDVMVSKHDPASGKPDTSALQIEPGIVLHLYEVVGTTQGRFHVVAGPDVRDVTLSKDTPMKFTFGARTLSLTLKSVDAKGANIRVE
jgi:hypothetical protein